MDIWSFLSHLAVLLSITDNLLSVTRSLIRKRKDGTTVPLTKARLLATPVDGWEYSPECSQARHQGQNRNTLLLLSEVAPPPGREKTGQNGADVIRLTSTREGFIWLHSDAVR